MLRSEPGHRGAADVGVQLAAGRRQGVGAERGPVSGGRARSIPLTVPLKPGPDRPRMAPYGSSFVFGPGFFGFLGPRLGGVRSSFLDRHQVHQVGDRHHREYWIPAEELAEFDSAIVGSIEVTRRFP